MLLIDMDLSHPTIRAVDSVKLPCGLRRFVVLTEGSIWTHVLDTASLDHYRLHSQSVAKAGTEGVIEYAASARRLARRYRELKAAGVANRAMKKHVECALARLRLGAE